MQLAQQHPRRVVDARGGEGQGGWHVQRGAQLPWGRDGDGIGGDGNPLENAKHNRWGKGGHLEFGVSLVHKIRWTPFF